MHSRWCISILQKLKISLRKVIQNKDGIYVPEQTMRTLKLYSQTQVYYQQKQNATADFTGISDKGSISFMEDYLGSLKCDESEVKNTPWNLLEYLACKKQAAQPK